MNRWDGTPGRDPARPEPVAGEIRDEREDADARLVQALRGGEPGALEVLIDRHGDRIYGLALRITGAEKDAEAATEDVLRQIVRDMHDPAMGTALGPRLVRLAARAAHARRAPGRTIGELDLDHLLPALDRDGGHFESVEDWSGRVVADAAPGDVRRVLVAAIAALPPDDRSALVLHDVEGVPDADIAAT